MKRKLLAIFLFLSLCSFALSKIIEIKVMNIYYQPLSKANIILKEENKIFQTDSSGKAIIDISEKDKKIKVKVEKKGYFSKTVLLKNLSKKIVKIYLIPKKALKESITVTALNYKEKSINTPITENEVDFVEIKEKIPENIVSSIKDTTGVYFIGKGGYSITPSIRGLGRRRILTMIDEVRIVSDRSVGTSASFMPTSFVDRIEIIRSPISILYGTDAIGGIINIFSLKNDFNYNKHSIYLSYKIPSNRIDTNFSFNENLGGINILSSINLLNSDNYSSPKGEIYNSRYSMFSGFLKVEKKGENSNFYIEYIGSHGKNIGKPSRENNPGKTKTYPYENNHIINLGYNNRALINDGEIKFNLFINPYNYKLDKIDKDESSISKTESLNGGLKLLIKKVYGKLIVQTGLDYYSRTNINIENIEIKSGETISDFFPIKNGKRKDYGVFTTFDYGGIKNTDIIFGARYGYYRINSSEYNNNLNAFSLYLGITRRIGKHLSLFSSIGNGHRIPSVSEAAYSGISGRGTIIANPDLVPEKSLNIDGGIKIYDKDIFFGFFLFKNNISNIIDKFDLGGDFYTYKNINSGTVKGFETEFQLYPFKFLEISGNYINYKGETDTSGLYLNDVPSPKFFFKVRLFYDRFYFETNYLYSSKKDNPGPAEVVNNSFNIVNIKSGFYYSSKMYLFLKISNLFNAFYYANADPKIPPQEGRSISFGINYNF